MTYRRFDRVHQFTTIERPTEPTLFDKVYCMGGTVRIASATRTYVQWDHGYDRPVWVNNKYLFPGEPPNGYLTGFEEVEMQA